MPQRLRARSSPCTHHGTPLSPKFSDRAICLSMDGRNSCQYPTMDPRYLLYMPSGTASRLRALPTRPRAEHHPFQWRVGFIRRQMGEVSKSPGTICAPCSRPRSFVLSAILASIKRSSQMWIIFWPPSPSHALSDLAIAHGTLFRITPTW